MVVKMIRWPPWPPVVTKKYEVRLVVKRLEGFINTEHDGSLDNIKNGGEGRGRPSVGGGNGNENGLAVEIRWKGPKSVPLMSTLRRRTALKRDFTKEVKEKDGVFTWEEDEFQSVCTLSAYNKDTNSFHPWEISFTLLNGLKPGPKNKVSVIGTASLNLAEFISEMEQKEFNMTLPLTMMAPTLEHYPSLCISIGVVELRTAQEFGDTLQNSIVFTANSNHSPEVPLSSEKDELSVLKAGLRKVKILTGYMTTQGIKKVLGDHEDGSEEGKGQLARSEEDGDYPFDSDSFGEYEEEETGDDVHGESSSIVRKSFCYGSLAYMNNAGGPFLLSARVHGGKDDEDWIYYGHRKSDVSYRLHEEMVLVSDPSLIHTSKRSINLLPWKKRKLSFRSIKAKGEPLLKKAYAEEGGDDIDYDRRQLTSNESSCGWHKIEEDSTGNQSSVSEFGDESFSVGSWESVEITNRDGNMKLQTRVFFASIDQRSEKAAGESACAVLVTAVADWFQNNREIMPIKSQFDTLIREGSLDWRNLCEDERYKERFPDKHFDLEAVLQAEIRPLTVHPGRSFIGFLRPPEGTLDEGRFNFLQGAMSFDNIWEEISHAGSNCNSDGGDCEPQVYIVSWNDHFFVLKVEPEAYYIIDTLGERLHEGCGRAYILKFDRNTKIVKLPPDPTPPTEVGAQSGPDLVCATGISEPKGPQLQQIKDVSPAGIVPMDMTMGEEVAKSEGEEEELVCQGKESCREYIKCFLAAIPIRELLADLKKGLVCSTLLHQRLQIEFHYTQPILSLTSPV